MTDNEIIKVGEICAYFYDNQNTSFSIVEVVKELSDEVVVVKFHQVLRDDSGNGLFTYLCEKDKTMNVSRKYLHKLDLINRQKAEIAELQHKIKCYNSTIFELEEHIEEQKAEVERLQAEAKCADGYADALVERAIKEFAERLKEKMRNCSMYCTDEHTYYLIGYSLIDNLVKEMEEERK